MQNLKTSWILFAMIFPLCAAGAVDCRPVLFSRSEAHYTTIDNPDFKDGDPEYLEEWRLLIRPTGGQLGALEITSLPAEAMPCVARMRVYQALPKDFLPPRKEPADPKWFEPMGIVDPAAPLRALRYEHKWPIDSLPASIPVALPQNLQKVNRCLLDILDQNGRVIYSCVPAEIFSVESYPDRRGKAWIMSEDEVADRRIREQTDINEVETLKEMPSEWQDYNEVKAIWIDENARVTAELLRRFMLSGGWILGRTNALDALCGRLGIPAELSLLGGGMAALDDGWMPKSEGQKRIPHNFYNSRFDFTGNCYRSKDNEHPLENSGAFFQRIRTKFFVFTFSFAGVYALGATILLPLLFLKLKGNQRVALWWKAPLALVIYSVLVLVVGWTWVLPRAPLTDVTEYRMGYGDWPEVFCNANAASLKFGRKPMGWELPPDRVPLFTDSPRAVPLVTDGGTGTGSVCFSGVDRGLRTISGYGFFREMRQPFTAEFRDGKVVVRSARAVRNLHAALENGHWIKLGSVNAGGETFLPEKFEALSINGCPELISGMIQMTDDPGVPLTTAEVKPEVCKNCGKVHGDAEKNLKLVDGSLILMAIDEEEVPLIRALNGNEIREGRVAWICQVPLKNWSPPKEEPKTGGRP